MNTAYLSGCARGKTSHCRRNARTDVTFLHTMASISREITHVQALESRGNIGQQRNGTTPCHPCNHDERSAVTTAPSGRQSYLSPPRPPAQHNADESSHDLTPMGSPSSSKNSVVPPTIFVREKQHHQRAGGEGTGQRLHGEGGGSGGRKKRKKDDKRSGEDDDEPERDNPPDDDGKVSDCASTSIFVPRKKDGKGDAVDGGDADLDRTGASGAAKATGATRGGAAADSSESNQEWPDAPKRRRRRRSDPLVIILPQWHHISKTEDCTHIT